MGMVDVAAFAATTKYGRYGVVVVVVTITAMRVRFG
jgi:hypothetical protein